MMTTERRPAPQRTAGETRQRILGEALCLFSRDSYAGTGMRDIARAAGLTEGAIYHHFRNKEDLLLAIIEVRLGAMRFPSSDTEALVELFADLPARQMLAHIADHLLVQWRRPDHQALVRILLAESMHNPEVARLMLLNFVAPLRTMLARVFAAQQAAGNVRRDLSPDLLARQLLGCIMMPLQQHFLLGGEQIDPVDIEAYLRQSLDVFAAGLVPVGGAS